MKLSLETPIQYVPRVGPMMAGKLDHLGIVTVQDLLYYAPFRYNDFSKITPISRCRIGDTVTINATVESIKNIFTKTGKKLQQATVADVSGKLTIIWFNQIYLPSVIHSGDTIALSGPIQWFGRLVVMASPVWEIIHDNQPSLHTGRIVPVYSETAGLTSKWLRGRIDYVLQELLPDIEEFLPEETKITYHLMPIKDALSQIHFPNSLNQAQDARRRLAFDELFILQLRSRILKRQWQEQTRSPKLPSNSVLIKPFLSSLPFEFTGDQTKALGTITSDLEKPIPMNRLLEGDVGSGKTVVAAAALYVAVKNGYSGVVMAPTQILAQQHYDTISQLLKPFEIPVTLIMGNNKKTESRGKNQPSVTVGTHALLSQTTEFENVGLLVIDEQQRFGVGQRSLIRKKTSGTMTPHLLTMTATPIPRTIALTLYGHLDLSTLTQMPKGRKIVKTWLVPNDKRDGAYTWIRKELESHDCRAFIVCPFIDPSESMISVKAAKAEFEKLRTKIFPDIPMGLLHGKIKSQEKSELLTALGKGKIKILVTTPVVEVGIDIPEATMMVVEGADRFGLSQLHQLRGRVGRSDMQSYCLLFTDTTDEKSQKRLKELETSFSGPELAQIDLSLRGEGDVLGTRQHGIPTLALASLSDRGLVEESGLAVTAILTKDPQLTDFPLLRTMAKKNIINDGMQD